MTVLVCGGAGYIGSHVNKMLAMKGYDTVVFDNLEYGHREFVKWGELIEGDLKNYDDINAVFKQYRIDAVFHFAAYTYVGESVTSPGKYYRNNVANTLNLLDAMIQNGCKKIVFSSTCATYGTPKALPLTEDMPQEPINPYGATKLMVERIFKDFKTAYGLDFAVLRYFNACGADPEGEIGEWHDPETHLIPLMLDAASGKSESIKIFGDDYPTKDGTCIRDYIHVWDLAKAHLLSLDYLTNGGKSDFFNLGNEKGTSVMEVVNAVKRVTGKDFKTEIAPRRPGDPPVLVGSSDKARRVLGWVPEYDDIDVIVKHAWGFARRED